MFAMKSYELKLGQGKKYVICFRLKRRKADR
jgi:hypothetical protein